MNKSGISPSPKNWYTHFGWLDPAKTKKNQASKSTRICLFFWQNPGTDIIWLVSLNPNIPTWSHPLYQGIHVQISHITQLKQDKEGICHLPTNTFSNCWDICQHFVHGFWIYPMITLPHDPTFMGWWLTKKSSSQLTNSGSPVFDVMIYSPILSTLRQKITMELS